MKSHVMMKMRRATTQSKPKVLLLLAAKKEKPLNDFKSAKDALRICRGMECPQKLEAKAEEKAFRV